MRRPCPAAASSPPLVTIKPSVVLPSQVAVERLLFIFQTVTCYYFTVAAAATAADATVLFVYVFLLQRRQKNVLTTTRKTEHLIIYPMNVHRGTLLLHTIVVRKNSQGAADPPTAPRAVLCLINNYLSFSVKRQRCFAAPRRSLFTI